MLVSKDPLKFVEGQITNKKLLIYNNLAICFVINNLKERIQSQMKILMLIQQGEGEGSA